MGNRLLDAVAAAFGPRPPERMGVAVSGGGDSIALLSILARYAYEQRIELHVITVDHGLRPETKEEIKVVTGLCHKLGLQHHLEYWTNWDGHGNLQAQARDGRYTLMADWAYAHQITHVALGHTADDQAETVLMRMARSGGVDGLSAMSPRHIRDGITWVRPFLAIPRLDLRSYLQAAGLLWIDDPSNLNRDFERIRIRDALTVLETLGIGVEALAQVAGHMAQAREALDWQTFLAARELADVRNGAIALEVRRFRTLPTEIKRRLLVHCLTWLSGSTYPPRRDAMSRALEAVQTGQTITLNGCQISTEDQTVWLYRELKAVAEMVVEVGDVWDDRWFVDGPDDDPDIEVRALGYDILPELENWRDSGMPRAAIAVTPSVWYEGRLVAAPIAAPDDEWSAELEGGPDAFFAALLSH